MRAASSSSASTARSASALPMSSTSDSNASSSAATSETAAREDAAAFSSASASCFSASVWSRLGFLERLLLERLRLGGLLGGLDALRDLGGVGALDSLDLSGVVLAPWHRRWRPSISSCSGGRSALPSPNSVSRLYCLRTSLRLPPASISSLRSTSAAWYSRICHSRGMFSGFPASSQRTKERISVSFCGTVMLFRAPRGECGGGGTRPGGPPRR